MFQYKKILIFGGAGSLGTELCRFLYDKTDEILVASRDEGKHWDLRNKFSHDVMHNRRIQTLLCDVRDAKRVKEVIRDAAPTYIIIAQALKQVDTCEAHPGECIDTNITGVRNILDAIREEARFNSKLNGVVFVSTDKACNPINVYGMSKSISEKLVLNAAKNHHQCRYMVTRYGNVISSKGSIIPLFEKQATSSNKSFTVTDPDMTRFMMLLSESVDLIDYAMSSGKSGDILVPKLDSFKVGDLARFFSEKYEKPIVQTGIRPGEKMHEIMINAEEWERIISLGKYFSINKHNCLNRENISDYSSKDCVVSYEELSARLTQFLETQTYRKKSS